MRKFLNIKILQKNIKRISVLLISSILINITIFGTLSLIPISIDAQTNDHTGTRLKGYTIISQNTTWSKTNSPYILSGNLLIEKGKTLTINPGVEIRLDNEYYIQVEGKLSAIGTKNNMIIFTSNKKDPKPGDWGSIIFANNADNGSSIEYCKIEYSNKGIEKSCWDNPYILTTISNNYFINNSNGINLYYGFDVSELTNFNVTIQISNNTIMNSIEKAFYLFCRIHQIGYLNYSEIKNNFKIEINNNIIQNNEDGLHIESVGFITQINGNIIKKNKKGIYGNFHIDNDIDCNLNIINNLIIDLKFAI